jgi:hypothetical protein
VASLLLAGLTGCGGGGGGSTTPSNSTPTVQQYAYGIWDGTFGLTPVKMVVLPNGGFFQWFGTSAPLGQLHGSLSVSTTNQLGFISSDGMLNGLYLQNGTVTTSSIATSSTLSFTVRGLVLSAGASATTSYSFSFNNSYNVPITNTDLAGNYSGILMGQSSTFSIDSLGGLTGVNGVCSFNGTISPDVSKGYALVSMTISGVNCATSGSSFGYLVKSGTGAGQQLWIGVSSGMGTQNAYGSSIVGTKQ